MSTSDYLALATLLATVLFGIPTLLLVISQHKEMRLARRKEIGEIIAGKNWNNLGVKPANEILSPTMELVIDSIDVRGFFTGILTNCQGTAPSLAASTFLFEGIINHKGKANLNLLISTGRPAYVGVAKIEYIREDNSINFFYLNDHKDNTSLSHELNLPRYHCYGLRA